MKLPTISCTSERIGALKRMDKYRANTKTFSHVDALEFVLVDASVRIHVLSDLAKNAHHRHVGLAGAGGCADEQVAVVVKSGLKH